MTLQTAALIVYYYLDGLGFLGVALWFVIRAWKTRAAHLAVWDSPPEAVAEFGQLLLSGPAEIPIVAAPRARHRAVVDVGWLAPTGAHAILPTAVYGHPALVAPPPPAPCWRRWETPPGGVPVLTASGVA